MNLPGLIGAFAPFLLVAFPSLGQAVLPVGLCEPSMQTPSRPPPTALSWSHSYSSAPSPTPAFPVGDERPTLRTKESLMEKGLAGKGRWEGVLWPRAHFTPCFSKALFAQRPSVASSSCRLLVDLAASQALPGSVSGVREEKGACAQSCPNARPGALSTPSSSSSRSQTSAALPWPLSGLGTSGPFLNLPCGLAERLPHQSPREATLSFDNVIATFPLGLFKRKGTLASARSAATSSRATPPTSF